MGFLEKEEASELMLSAEGSSCKIFLAILKTLKLKIVLLESVTDAMLRPQALRLTWIGSVTPILIIWAT